MIARAREGACLEALVSMAIPLCQAAEHLCPRTGPGHPPEFPDWWMATHLNSIARSGNMMFQTQAAGRLRQSAAVRSASIPVRGERRSSCEFSSLTDLAATYGLSYLATVAAAMINLPTACQWGQGVIPPDIDGDT